MAVKKSEIYSSLWASCDALRGGMDASQYKDYVLVLLFVKYVSDKYAGDPHGLIEVPEGGSFADMVALKGDKDIGEKINIIIRNEPSGSVDLKSVEFLPRNLAIPQPDGSVKALPDPRPESRFSNDLTMTLTGNAKIGDDGGIVFGNKKVKIGTTMELEGKQYNFSSTVVAVRNK